MKTRTPPAKKTVTAKSYPGRSGSLIQRKPAHRFLLAIRRRDLAAVRQAGH